MTEQNTNSVRHHDPYWFKKDSEVFQDYQPQRNTDYNFPAGWGRRSPEQKSRWFLKQRVFKQASRQFDNGVFPRWLSEVNGKSFAQAWGDADKSDYRFDD